MTRTVLLAKFDDKDLDITTILGLDDFMHVPFTEELRAYFERNGHLVRRQGLIYSKSLDSYFYIQTLDDYPNYYVLSHHDISSCMSFYYNLHIIHERFDEHFSKYPEDWIHSPNAKLTEWSDIYEHLSQETEQAPYENNFDSALMEWINHNFENFFAELFFALLLQIPIIVSSKENTTEIASYFRRIVPHFTIHEGTNPATSFHHVHIVQQPEFTNFIEYLYLNTDTRSVKYEFLTSYQAGLGGLINDAMQFHEMKIMSFDISIYNHIFWMLQKIYGVFLVHTGRINFDSYLHKEKKYLHDTLTHLFNEITFLDNLHV